MLTEKDWEKINNSLIKLYEANGIQKKAENFSDDEKKILADLKAYFDPFSKAISDFSLSERESVVLRLIAEGRSNAYISEEIHISVSTVKKHVYNIFNKAGVNSRTQLLNMVYGIGF